jgi:hypothetical protein
VAAVAKEMVSRIAKKRSAKPDGGGDMKAKTEEDHQDELLSMLVGISKEKLYDQPEMKSSGGWRPIR